MALRKIPNSPGDYSRRFLWASVLAVVFALGLVWFGSDCQPDRLFAASPYHRLQVEALLGGRLSLSSSIERIDHGLTWHDGQINQVWGLGVPIWMLPFELAYRLFGGRTFPDRVALLAAMALVAWYASHGGAAVAKVLRSRAAGITFVYLVLLFPPLWNLILGPRAIFEQTVLYACLVSIALLVAVVRFVLFQRRGDFWVACVLGGLSGLVRVTHGVYGMTAGMICGFVMLRSVTTTASFTKKSCDWRKIGELLLGWAVLLGGFLFLAYSNSIRFGSVTECGHRLTNHTMDVIYLTRFGNPFQNASLVDASKELFSWIYLSPFHHYGSDAPDLIPWQASAYRWRGPSQLTFDPSFLLITVFGCFVGAMFLKDRARRCSWRLLRLFNPSKPVQCIIAGMLIWFIVGTLLLAGFYLYVPILATRYILDLAPSFMAPFIMALLLLARRWPRLMPTLLVAWLCGESMALWLSRGSTSFQAELSKEELPSLPMSSGRKLASFNGRYAIENHPVETNIQYNGQTWNRDGMASPILTLVLDRPEFLEISVGQRPEEGGTPDSYRAKIGNLELPVESSIRTQDGSNVIVKVRFGIPDRIRHQSGDQLAFLCFTTGWEPKDRRSQRRLYEVRWKPS